MIDAQGRPVILFRIARFFDSDLHPELKGVDLWEEIKSGRKTSEWRDASDYWLKRLFSGRPLKQGGRQLRVWIVCGYPKANIPRLEATVTDIILWFDSEQIETNFKDVEEVTRNQVMPLGLSQPGRMCGVDPNFE